MERQDFVFKSLVRNSSLYFKTPNLNCSGECEEVEEQEKRRLVINATSKKLEPCDSKKRKIKIKGENDYHTNFNLPIIAKPKFAFLKINNISPLKEGRENSTTLIPVKVVDGLSMRSNDSMFL